MIEILIGTLGALSLGAAHWWVQGDAPDLVPRPWAAWLGVLWLLPGPLLGLGVPWAAWVWAIAMAGTGALAWPVAVRVRAARRHLAGLAQLGQREVDARRMLRRPSPPEVTRVLTPLRSELDPEAADRRVRQAWARLIEHRRASA